jgi:aminoglycoside phosphotransferase family enzyme
MQERLANRVESGDITQAEADDIRAKIADRKAKIRPGERPSEAAIEARKAEMQERLANRVESGDITQAEADDIRAKIADRKAKFQQRKGTP